MIAFLMTIENEIVKKKLEEIYKIYHRDMYITAYSILRDHYDAEDVVQDAVLRISNNLHKISEIKCKKTRSYMVIIVKNLSYNSYNKRKGIVLLEHEEVKGLLNEDEVLIEEQLIKMNLRIEIAEYLGRLHPSYADILTLRFYYELEINEISKVLDITENNVSVRISRAITALKKVLEEEGVDYEQTV